MDMSVIEKMKDVAHTKEAFEESEKRLRDVLVTAASMVVYIGWPCACGRMRTTAWQSSTKMKSMVF